MFHHSTLLLILKPTPQHLSLFVVASNPICIVSRESQVVRGDPHLTTVFSLAWSDPRPTDPQPAHGFSC